MNADYWEERTALIGDGAVRVLSLSTPEEVDYWRDQLKSNRRNNHELEADDLGKTCLQHCAGAQTTVIWTKSQSTSFNSFAPQKANC